MACSVLRMGVACGLAPTPDSFGPEVSLPLVRWECVLGSWGLARGQLQLKLRRQAGGQVT